MTSRRPSQGSFPMSAAAILLILAVATPQAVAAAELGDTPGGRGGDAADDGDRSEGWRLGRLGLSPLAACVACAGEPAGEYTDICLARRATLLAQACVTWGRPVQGALDAAFEEPEVDDTAFGSPRYPLVPDPGLCSTCEFSGGEADAPCNAFVDEHCEAFAAELALMPAPQEADFASLWGTDGTPSMCKHCLSQPDDFEAPVVDFSGECIQRTMSWQRQVCAAGFIEGGPPLCNSICWPGTGRMVLGDVEECTEALLVTCPWSVQPRPETDTLVDSDPQDPDDHGEPVYDDEDGHFEVDANGQGGQDLSDGLQPETWGDAAGVFDPIGDEPRRNEEDERPELFGELDDDFDREGGRSTERDSTETYDENEDEDEEGDEPRDKPWISGDPFADLPDEEL